MKRKRKKRHNEEFTIDRKIREYLFEEFHISLFSQTSIEHADKDDFSRKRYPIGERGYSNRFKIHRNGEPLLLESAIAIYRSTLSLYNNGVSFPRRYLAFTSSPVSVYWCVHVVTLVEKFTRVTQSFVCYVLRKGSISNLFSIFFLLPNTICYQYINNINQYYNLCLWKRCREIGENQTKF